jgi:DNA-binding NarL/FixJ family response regulator
MSTSVAMSAVLRGQAEQQKSLRVLVVGRRGVFTEALTRLLLASGITAVHTDGDQVELELVRCPPEVVLLEGGLGAKRLIGCAELVRSACSPVRVLLLATGDEDATLVEQLQVAAVLSAWSAPEELLAAITGDGRQGRGRRRPAGGRDQSHRGRSQGPLWGSRFPDSRLSQLTARELEILRKLMAGASGAEIAEALSISTHTVRTHVRNILIKLDARTRLEAATIGFREGLRPLGRFSAGGSQAR